MTKSIIFPEIVQQQPCNNDAFWQSMLAIKINYIIYNAILFHNNQQILRKRN